MNGGMTGAGWRGWRPGWLVLAACGSGGGGGPNPTPAPVAGAPGGKLTIGIAFDQPGLGSRPVTPTPGSTWTPRSTSPARWG